MSIKYLTYAAVACFLLLTSCDDTTDTIGVTLSENADHLEVSSSTFYAYSHSVSSGSVVSRSSTGYLGRIIDPETGTYITGDFMTQFYCIENLKLTPADSVLSRDAEGKVIADSCEVRLFYTNYYGDSLANMKFTLYEMDHPMVEDQHYYSDFSPLEEGYIRQGGLSKSHSFSIVNNSELTEKTKDSEYVNNICVRLNQPYTDRDGITYNNFGTYVLRKYYEHPEYFQNTNSFTRNILPGFFFKMTGGLGAMAYIRVPQLNIFFNIKKDGEQKASMTLFNGTEEVLQTTTVTNDTQAIEQLVNDPSCTYIKSPAGIFTEVTLPVDDIVRGHEKDTINTAKIEFLRINNEHWSSYNLPAPSMLLMIETDSVQSFFEQGKVANYKQTFLGSYSKSANKYAFNNVGGIINAMNKARNEGLKSDPQWEAHHPNWNKVMLVPVSTTTVTYNNTTRIVGIHNDMSLTSTRLVGGNTPIAINIIYSRFD